MIKIEKPQILVREATTSCLEYSIASKATHPEGNRNSICDSLSRLCLHARISNLLEHSLVPSTYEAYEKQYRYLRRFGQPKAFQKSPATYQELILFISYFADRGYMSSTISSYQVGIGFNKYIPS